MAKADHKMNSGNKQVQSLEMVPDGMIVATKYSQY